MLKGIITAPKKWAVILFMLDIFICAGQQMPELRRNSIRHWTMLDSLGNSAVETASHYDPLGRKQEVVAIYQGNLVVDSKAQTEMKGFDTATLMQRFIWYNYPSEE